MSEPVQIPQRGEPVRATKARKVIGKEGRDRFAFLASKGLSYAEIAFALDISPAAARQLGYRARKYAESDKRDPFPDPPDGRSLRWQKDRDERDQS